MSSTFSGSLQAKKKAELQEICQALRITDAGTRDELQLRIKKHLDNTAELADDPIFAGLFSKRRQRSAQPQPQPSTSNSRPSGMPAIQEQKEGSPGFDDRRDVSMMLPRAPYSIDSPSPRREVQAPATPSSLPPLPPSPAKSLVEDALQEVNAVVEEGRNVVRSYKYLLHQTRSILSNGRNIFVITTLVDCYALISAIHKDAYFPFPIPPITEDIRPALTVTSFACGHWSLPNVILPIIAGFLISFTTNATSGAIQFDVLIASIIRLAANVAFQFPGVPLTVSDIDGTAETGTISLDVLGRKRRVFTSGVMLAIALAEAVGRRTTTQFGSSILSSRASTPRR